jgi:hypothetical protein
MDTSLLTAGGNVVESNLLRKRTGLVALAPVEAVYSIIGGRTWVQPPLPFKDEIEAMEKKAIVLKVDVDGNTCTITGLAPTARGLVPSGKIVVDLATVSVAQLQLDIAGMVLPVQASTS